MSATRNNVCGSCLAWTSLVLLFISLVIPWYLISTHIENIDTGLGDCDHEQVCGEEDVHAFWGEKDNHLGTVFAPTFFLMLLTTIIALLAALVFSARCCCMQASSPRAAMLLTKAALFLAILGVLALTIAIIIFAALLPNAWKASVDDETEAVKGPWDSFIGRDEREFNIPDVISIKTKFVWARVGWWFAVLAWPFLVGTTIALFTAERSARTEHAYSIINQ